MVAAQCWGRIEGKDVLLYTITNKHGASVALSNFGARVVAVKVPDQAGILENVVLGFSTLEGYMQDKDYMGATIGRFANRIAGGSFCLDGEKYLLETNDGEHNNHGGYNGFHKQVFEAKIEGENIEFSIRSPDGAGGFPGELDIRVIYSWDDEHILRIRYEGCSDKKTILNLTNHSYFNLSGSNDNILSHNLSIYADGFIETDAKFIPTGRIHQVGAQSSRGDLLKKKMAHDEYVMQEGPVSGNEIERGIRGFNDCYVLKSYQYGLAKDAIKADLLPQPACLLSEQQSGRTLTVWTTYPGLLLYTGDYLKSYQMGHHGRPYRPFDGLSLECQYYPDSPHFSGFPSVVLEVGQRYDETIILKFGILESTTY